MAKPTAIQWLEEQTGASIDYVPDARPSSDRHLSVRLNDDLAAGLELMAREHTVSVSQLVRELLSQAVRSGTRWRRSTPERSRNASPLTLPRSDVVLSADRAG